ncbi:MAG: hypothetical protein KY476_05705 [Planctomycetes bacterium]|nr:hypothetical protein [Planctomycetota bacterium]
MRYFISVLAFCSIVATSAACRADGLFYKLPEDGVWAQYDLKMEPPRGDEEPLVEGSFRMASVGSTTENGEKCRWIEMVIDIQHRGRAHKTIAKVLFPEKQLAEGKQPVEHIVRGWLKEGEREVHNVTEDLGPMPAFLAGPLEDKKKLKPVTLDTPLGKLDCEGVTGTTAWDESGHTDTATIETRLNDKAPFGVVTSTIAMKREQNGNVRDRGKLVFTLTKTGTDAKSELPDQN